MRRFAIAALSAALLPLGAQAHDYTAGDMTVIHPAIPETPPGARSAAGYFTLVNGGDAPDSLIEVRADVPAVGLHRSESVDDVMTMTPVDRVEVAPGAEVVFAPGGLHVMFMGLEAPMGEGDMVPATLVFERAGPVEVEFSVDARETMDHGDHAGH